MALLQIHQSMSSSSAPFFTDVVGELRLSIDYVDIFSIIRDDERVQVLDTIANKVFDKALELYPR